MITSTTSTDQYAHLDYTEFDEESFSSREEEPPQPAYKLDLID